jgi:type I restriction enzyme S subunit
METTLSDVVEPRVEQRPLAGEPVPYVDISSIDRATKRIGELVHVDADSAPTRARQWVKAGDVLVSMTRPNLNAVAIVPVNLGGAVASTGFDVLRAVGVLPEWIFNRVCSREFVSDVCENLQGVVYPAIRPRDVRAHKLPVPPLAEQQRIVAAIESHLTRLDNAVALLERVEQNLKRYRAAVLKAAVQGRLVPTEAGLARQEGREYEPASELLKRILAERKTRWIEDAAEKARKAGQPWTPKDGAAILEKEHAKAAKLYKEPRAPETTDDLPGLPEGWCWARAEEVCEFITKGTTPRADLMTSKTGEVPFIKVYNLTFDGTLDFGIDPTYVAMATHRGPLARSRVLPGDVLANIVGPPLGKTAVVPDAYPEWNINQAVARFRPVNGLSGAYLAAVLGSQAFLGWATQRSKATAGQFNLTLETCRDAPIPLAPEAEQRRIAGEITRAIVSGDAALAEAGLAAGRCARLRQSILKWAFEGKLVDQDPNDEPASVLLDRIRSGRAAST